MKTRYQHNYRTRQGFSLIEVLVAIFIVAIGVILFGYFAKSLKTTSNARIETEAMISIRSGLEDTRGLWSNGQGFSSGELPFFVKAPNGYTALTVTVKTLQTADQNYDFSCTYTYNENIEKFENPCSLLNPEDSGTLLRHVDFQLSSPDKEPLTLSMELARPIE